MAKRLLDSPDYTLTTGGFWRLIWSLISRHPGFSNWLIVDRRNHTEFRLTVEEQEAMSNFAGHSGAWMLSPDFRNLSFQQKITTRCPLLLTSWKHLSPPEMAIKRSGNGCV